MAQMEKNHREKRCDAMKKIVMLLIVVGLCILLASCTNRDSESSVETTEGMVSKTESTEYEEDLSVTEETEKPRQEAACEKNLKQETQGAYIEEEKDAEVSEYAPKDDYTIPPAIDAESEILISDSEFGSPGIDD